MALISAAPDGARKREKHAELNRLPGASRGEMAKKDDECFLFKTVYLGNVTITGLGDHCRRSGCIPQNEMPRAPSIAGRM